MDFFQSLKNKTKQAISGVAFPTAKPTMNMLGAIKGRLQASGIVPANNEIKAQEARGRIFDRQYKAIMDARSAASTNAVSVDQDTGLKKTTNTSSSTTSGNTSTTTPYQDAPQNGVSLEDLKKSQMPPEPSDIEKRILGTYKPSDYEAQLQQKTANLLSSEEMGLAKMGEQAIPLDLVRGQQEALQKRVSTQLTPLQRQLEIEQGKRISEREKATQEREFSAPIEIDGQLVQKQGDGSYKSIYGTPKPDYGTGAIGEYNFAKSQGYTGSFTDYQNEDANRKKSIAAAGVGSYGTGTPGQLSPLAQAVQNGTIAIDKIPMAQRAQIAAELATSGIPSSLEQTKKANLEVVQSLIDNPHKNLISGYFQGKLGFGSLDPRAQLALNEFDQLKGILSLANREQLKGTGAISDFEFKVLSQAATALGRNLNDEQFNEQLQKIADVFSGKYRLTNITGSNDLKQQIIAGYRNSFPQATDAELEALYAEENE